MRTIATLRAFWAFMKAYTRAFAHLPNPLFGYASMDLAVITFRYHVLNIWERTQ